MGERGGVSQGERKKEGARVAAGSLQGSSHRFGGKQEVAGVGQEPPRSCFQLEEEDDVPLHITPWIFGFFPRKCKTTPFLSIW
jgi:hypothetical protein